MIRKTVNLAVIIQFLIFSDVTFASEFDELDKPPEGAHAGQMLLGAFVFIGPGPYGEFIDAENDYLDGSTYAFDADTQKMIEVSHLYIGLGATFEYMPFDYIGVCAKLRKDHIYQQTNFGPDYENWKGLIYRGVSFLIGPTIHTTNRKRWDFILTPLIGYNYARYYATSVGRQIIDDSTGGRKQSSTGLSFGAELNLTLYFSGGLFISLGVEWISHSLKFEKIFNIANPQIAGRQYEPIKEGNMSSIDAIITAGYAFSN